YHGIGSKRAVIQPYQPIALIAIAVATAAYVDHCAAVRQAFLPPKRVDKPTSIARGMTGGGNRTASSAPPYGEVHTWPSAIQSSARRSHRASRSGAGRAIRSKAQWKKLTPPTSETTDASIFVSVAPSQTVPPA